MLELIVFTSGGVLLVLEVVASRVLAPFFGNSVYVWGSLIGVFLAGLTLGYFAGGRIADRWPSPTLFSALVFLAGALTFPIPFIAGDVMETLVLRGLGPRGGSLAAAAALFFLPSVVMGTVSPFAVRLRARTVATVGNVAGILYALSTLGSIAGTLLAAFVLINAFGVRSIIHGLGIVLMVMAVVGLVAARRIGAAAGAAVTAGALMVVVLAGPASPAGEAAGIVFAQDTVYHRITVSDEGRVRYLKLDNYWQSAVDLDDPRRTVFSYSDFMHLPLLFAPRPRNVALIGLGGGTVPRRYLEDYPDVEMHVAEIDPAVVDTAMRWFDLPRTPRLRVSAQDGRLFLFLARQSYDVILLDAYLIDTIPFHLATREFFALAASRLSQSGVLATNIIGALEGSDSRLFRAIYKTLREVFPTVYVFPVDYSPVSSPESLRNIIVVASREPAISPVEVQRRVQSFGGGIRFEGLVRAAGSQYTRPIAVDDVPVLTDDYAPVDALIPRQ